MRLAFFGYDFSFSTLQRLMADGHDVVKVFSFPVDNMFMFNAHLQALCEQNSIAFPTEKVNENDIAALCDDGVELIVSAGYLYKIPALDENKIRGINIHPTYLPYGRGMMPMPRLILEHPEVAGITVHKIAAEYDMGDILAQQKIELMPQEDIETLSAKITMRMPDMASEAISHLDELWDNAKPQNLDEGSWWEPYSKEEMTINWDDSVDRINHQHRAFGRYGMIAKIKDQVFAVFQLRAWQEKHSYAAGDVVCVMSREVVIAVKDGFVILKEFQNIEG